MTNFITRDAMFYSYAPDLLFIGAGLCLLWIVIILTHRT